MESNTLDELGQAILERATTQRVTAADLASTLEASRDAVDERVAQLVDNALLRPVDDEYELTENGRRVLNATPIGRYDNRIDTPPHIEDAIEAFECRPDEAAAVRNAVSFLRYWGEATTAELVDATYSEVPAGYETADRWWDDCVRERLEALPDVQPPPNGPIPATWRYDGEAVIEQPDDDGRDVPDPTAGPSSLGSVRHALEAADPTDDERTAARVAFTALFDRREATTETLVDAVFEDYPAGYDSRDAWADWLTATFDGAPGIERLEEGQSVEWRYTPGVDESGLEE